MLGAATSGKIISSVCGRAGGIRYNLLSLSGSRKMSSSRFSGLPKGPVIEPFLLTAQFKADKHPKKVNIGQGSYRTNESQPFVLPVVQEVEEELVKDLKSGKINHEYLPVLGLQEFRAAAARFILGADSPALKEGRVVSAQCLSGTGAIRLAAEFLATKLGFDTCYNSVPTWGNHFGIFKAAGFKNSQTYRYWDASSRSLDLKGMLEDLEGAPENAVIVLHACAHNPTGVDPTEEQWRKIAEVVKRKKLFTFFDCAYQGFASGNPDADAGAVRLFDSLGLEFLVCQSFAKNFGLYNARVGCLTMCVSDASAKDNLAGQLEGTVRQMYSNPPAQGAWVVSRILDDADKYARWKGSVEEMAGRIRSMREGLRSRLEKLTGNQWPHITDQIGMFSFTGLSEEQTKFLIEEKHIYLLRNGRVNMSGLTSSNLDYVAESIAEACKKFPNAKL